MEAINLFGVLKGTRLAIKRIIRCHPWGESGYDPINAKNIKRIRK
jgi:putative component of membrane protein insertase Oxa1/YidC/SpoIIIJ protein YidD